MATLQMRDYGSIGSPDLATALGKLTRDKATWTAAVNDTSATNETVELAYHDNTDCFVAIDYSMPCWNNGTLAIGTGVTLVVAGTHAGGGPLFDGGAGKTNFMLTGTGDADPTGWGGEKSGKFAIIIDPAQTNADPHTQVMAFTTSNGIEVAYLYILGNWDTQANGCATGNQMSTAGFTYPGTGGCQSTNPGANDITLRCVTYDRGPAGYGLTQIQSGTNLRYFSCKGIGGKVLRVEQDAGNMNYIRNLTADGLWGKWGGPGQVVLQPHQDNRCVNPPAGASRKAGGTLDGIISITNVTVEECETAIRIAGTCNPAGGTGYQGTINIDGVAVQGATGSGTASDPYSKHAQIITGGGSGLQACFADGVPQIVVDGSGGSCVTISNVSVAGHFTNGNGGYNNSGFASRFGAGFPCGSTNPQTGHHSDAIASQTYAGTAITQIGGEAVTDDAV